MALWRRVLASSATSLSSGCFPIMKVENIWLGSTIVTLVVLPFCSCTTTWHGSSAARDSSAWYTFHASVGLHAPKLMERSVSLPIFSLNAAWKSMVAITPKPHCS
jgi:hypothetical protein